MVEIEEVGKETIQIGIDQETTPQIITIGSQMMESASNAENQAT